MQNSQQRWFHVRPERRTVHDVIRMPTGLRCRGQSGRTPEGRVGRAVCPQRAAGTWEPVDDG